MSNIAYDSCCVGCADCLMRHLYGIWCKRYPTDIADFEIAFDLYFKTITENN